MKETRILMDMPIVIEVVDPTVTAQHIQKIYGYFHQVDEQFSPFKPTSEVSLINAGELKIANASSGMKEVWRLCEQTKKETRGFFNVYQNEKFDPSGLVKGWAIYQAAKKLKDMNFKNFYVEAGGDIQTSGQNVRHQTWQIGIRNPFNVQEVVQVVSLKDRGVATSGSYERGAHIYNPLNLSAKLDEIVSLTVIAKNIYEADRFATTNPERRNFLSVRISIYAFNF